MTKQQQSQQRTTTDLGELADPIDRLATVLADVSSELENLSQELRAQRVGVEQARRAGPEQQPDGLGGLPEARTESGQLPGLIPGEPVDTSFTDATQTPAAPAAGAFPSGAIARWTPWGSSRTHVVVWTGTALALFGTLLLLIFFAQL